MTTVTQARSTSGGLPSPSGMGWRKVKNHLATVIIISCFLIALVPLIWLLYTVVSKGWSSVSQSSWWTGTTYGVTPRRAGGGVLHALIGTLEQVALCSLISIPLALMIGIYLVEYGRGPVAKLASLMLDILTGIPSIVAALFIYAVFITTLHGKLQGFYVSLALVMLMVPVVVRTTEEMLKLVPNELREAAYALGVPKWKTIVRVVLPTALSGIVTGIVLGIARVAGETAPLLVLVGYNSDTNTNLFSGPQASLPGMIYSEYAGYPLPNPVNRAWGAALTLILLVMALNLIARLISRFSKVTN
jgi:phosphate transport system permease protein